ncbi:MAG: hypothetical protein JZU65_15425 [Chlorobium sp.]|nr:hypothetical protein [Chlorobium sp.]
MSFISLVRAAAIKLFIYNSNAWNDWTISGGQDSLIIRHKPLQNDIDEMFGTPGYRVNLDCWLDHTRNYLELAVYSVINDKSVMDKETDRKNRQLLARMLREICQKVNDQRLEVSSKNNFQVARIALPQSTTTPKSAETQLEVLLEVAAKIKEHLPISFFGNTQIEDLSGMGWDKWVWGILQDMNTWQLGDYAPLAKQQVRKRFTTLSTIFLVPSDIMREIRTICGGSQGNDWRDLFPWSFDWPDWDDENFPEDDWKEVEGYLDDLRNKHRNALEGDKTSTAGFPNQMDENREQNMPLPQGPEDIEGEWEDDEDTIDDWPVHGQSVDSSDCADVIIETYGAYVPSLQNWLMTMVGKGLSQQSLSTLKKLEIFLAVHPDSSGPAILLCPELIQKIPSRIGKHVRKVQDTRKAMPDGGTATMSALRMVLLHELGHHLFSNTGLLNSRADHAYKECLAQWFAHQMLPTWEQGLLEALALRQPPIYRIYAGLVLMQEKASGFDMLHELIVLSAFHGQMHRINRMCFPHHSFEYMADEISRYMSHWRRHCPVRLTKLFFLFYLSWLCCD